MKSEDPCWCGSSKTFRECHQSVPLDDPKAVQQRIEALRRNQRVKKCMHPSAPHDCSGSIVRAHTIQRSGGLSRIAQNQHVYSVKQESLTRFPRRWTPQKIGLNEASTFTGFCNRHDSQLFRPVEQQPFNWGAEHCFLLTYRALARELYAKEVAHTGYSLIQNMYPLTERDAQRATLASEANLQGLKELQQQKDRYDKILLTGSYDDVEFICFRLDKCPDFLCSTFFSPWFDFEEIRLQDGTDYSTLVEGLGLSIIPIDIGGAVVFSWLRDQVPCSRFINSFRRVTSIHRAETLRQLIFAVADNIYMSPKWWEGITDSDRDHFEMYFHMVPGKDMKINDERQYVSWKIVEVISNINWGS